MTAGSNTETARIDAGIEEDVLDLLEMLRSTADEMRRRVPQDPSLESRDLADHLRRLLHDLDALEHDFIRLRQIGPAPRADEPTSNRPLLPDSSYFLG